MKGVGYTHLNSSQPELLKTATEKNELVMRNQLQFLLSYLKPTCAGDTFSLVAISLITGSSMTTGSESWTLGRPGFPSGEYASRIIPWGHTHDTWHVQRQS